MGVPMPPGRVHSGPPTLGVNSKGLISEPGLPGRSRLGGPTAIHFFGPFDTPSGTNLESAIRRPTGHAAMPPAAGTGRGGEFYYVLIFGSQSSPKILRYTHTWATLVRVVGEGPDPRNYEIYAHTISWLPETLEFRVWRPWPEPGVNLDLYQTLDVVYSNRERVTMWDPCSSKKRYTTGRLGCSRSSPAAPLSIERSASRETCSSATASTPSRLSIRTSAASTTR